MMNWAVFGNKREMNMRPFLVGLLALLLPVAGLAQDTSEIEAEFNAAFTTYFPLGSIDQLDNLGVGLAIVPQVQGRWVPAHTLFPDGAFDADWLDTACRQVGVELAPTGRFGFTMTRMRGEEPLDAVTSYAFVGGSTFTRSTDLEGVVTMLYGERDLSEMPPASWLHALSSPMNHGHAILRMPSPNILVIESVASVPYLLMRCP